MKNDGTCKLWAGVTIVALVTLALLSAKAEESVSTPANAQEAAQALQLVKAAFACPIKPLVEKDSSRGVFNFYSAREIVQEFTGDTVLLKFKSSRRYRQKSEAKGAHGGNYDKTYVTLGDVPFNALQGGTAEKGSEAFEEGEAGLYLVQLTCIQGRKDCREAYRIPFCDSDTAKNALLAINILIKANQH